MKPFTFMGVEFRDLWDILDIVQLMTIFGIIWYSYTRGFYGPLFVGLGLLLVQLTPGLYRIVTEGW